MQPGESAGQQAQHRRIRAQSLREQSRALSERADRVERSGEMWSRGAAGEQTVGAQLELLRPYGFDLLHDVRWPGRRRANIDHVAIGPPGVLVVDAKNWSGSVTVRDGVVRQNGYQRTSEVEGVRQAGRDVGGQLQLPWALHVIPVIALAGSGTAGVRQCQDVTMIGHLDLVSWATGLPPQLTPGDVIGIASHLRTALPPASSHTPPQQRSSRSDAPVPRELSAKERAQRGKRKAAGREAVVKLVFLAVLVVALPSALAWWNAHGTDVVKAVVPIPSVSAAGPSAPVAEAYPGCKALRAVFPRGVKRPGGTNAGADIRRGVVVDAPAYQANAALDVDRDGLACERAKKG